MKHLIFDFFGTLGDADADKLCTNRSSLMRFGEYRWMIHDIDEKTFLDEYAIKHGIDPLVLRKSFNDFQDSIRLFPFAFEVLSELKKSFSIHLLSNVGNSFEKVLVKYSDFFGLFDSISLSYLIGLRKPQRGAFDHVLNMAGANPGECLMIGDNIKDDIIGAQKAGIKALCFNGRKQDLRTLPERISGNK